VTEGRVRREALLAALVFCATAAAATIYWQLRGDAVTDIPLYHTYGERLADGLVPYRDFGFEYPPGVLPFLALPALLTDSLRGYRIAFGVEMALVGAVGVLLVSEVLARLGRRDEERRLALTAVALLPLCLGGVILTRFDLLPAAFLAGALALLVAGRTEAGAFVLGLGIAVKLYPVVALPLVVVAAYRRAGRAAAARVVGAAALPVVVLYLPFLVVGLDGVLDSFGRQLGRPLQIESLGAGVLLALHHVDGLTLGWSSGAGSQNLTGGGAGTVAVLLAVAQVAAIVLVWALFARDGLTSDRLVRGTAAAVVAFVALSKVLSPQFLVWLLFLVPLVGGRGSRAALWLFAAACAATAFWFPARYWDLVREFDPAASWAVLLRGVLLLALLVVLIWPATARAPARSRSPAPLPDRR
jgi:hypothetical protein